MRKYPYLLVLVGLLFLLGCGGGGGGSDDTANEDSLTGEEDIAAAPEPETVVNTYFFGQSGNLWKPKGDDHGGSPGNLVALFSSQFTEQFESCQVRLNTGEYADLICINNQPWTQIPYSCFTNGNRQTWRAPFGCSSAGEVRVTCTLRNEIFEFRVPADGDLGKVCQRFG